MPRPRLPVNFASRKEEDVMDGSLPLPLQFPVKAPLQPGATQRVAPGIEWLRMPLPFALDHINLWLIEDGDGWTIVDTGYAMAETTALWERIFAGRLGGRPVTRIVVTHHHPDHIGLGGWLCERWQVPLWISEKEWLFARMLTGNSNDEADLSRAFGHRAGLDQAASEIFAEHHRGYRRGVPSVPASFERLSGGSEVEIGGQLWQVIVGEGHSPELACLYCAETGVLISGDQVLPKISPNVSVHAYEPNGNPLARFLLSLFSFSSRFSP
jgi:glyoxylase-like metal-dependent hydrolase (beta-lactamase superfamily II)